MGKLLTDEFFENNRLSMELDLMAKSVLKSKFKEAIEALRPLISEESYQRNKEEREYWAHRMFGTDKCHCGNHKPVRNNMCCVCYANRD